MKLTCVQKRLLKESKCPGCSNKDAYQSFYGDWECPEQGCKFFSRKRQGEVKGPDVAKAGSRLPTEEEWAALEQLAKTNGNGVANVKTKIDGYEISTACFIPGINNWPYETMVFDKHGDIVDEAGADSLQYAKDNHDYLVKLFIKKSL